MANVRPAIAAVVITLNEERNIAECLDSARWMDEIIVVDAFSQDRTVAICQKYTDKIFTRTWNGFGEQKNYAIDQATGEWVFILDADERISPELRREIEGVLASQNATGPVAYYVPRRNFHYGRWMRRGGHYPDYQLRLFRRGVGRLDNSEPHPRFVFQGDSGYLYYPLDHYTERSISDHLRKFRNLTTLAALERGRRKQIVYWMDLAFRPLFTFWKYYIVRQGFREGIHGLIICEFASMYTFLKYAKLWESLVKEREAIKGKAVDQRTVSTGPEASE